MALKVGINGFGRIGRLVLRASMLDEDIEFVGINDLVPAENLAYLLKYDSTHGRAKADIFATGDAIVINGRKIPCVSVKDPAELPWAKLGAQYVVESTGLFTALEGAKKHLGETEIGKCRHLASFIYGRAPRPPEKARLVDPVKWETCPAYRAVI